MSSQMAALRNMIENIPRPWPAAQNQSSLAAHNRAAYVSPDPSVTELLSVHNHVSLVAPHGRSLRGIFSTGMLAIRGLFARGGQRIWDNNASLQRNAYPTSRVSAEAGRLTLSSKSETSAELIDAGDTVTGEILDENHPIPDFGGLPETKLRVSPSFEETIVATWARVAQESRALGMPMKEDVVGYLHTQAHTWGRDEAESNSLIHKYETQINPEKHADYGTMPKDVGYAWAHSTLAYHEDENIEATRQAIMEEMRKWGWNDAAAAVVFGEIAQEKIAKEASQEAGPKTPVMSAHEPQVIVAPAAAWKHVPGQPRVQSPEQVAAASIRGGGNSGVTPPKKTSEPEGWRKWLPLGVAGGVVLAVVGVVLGGEAVSRRSEPVPPPSAAAPSSPATQTPGVETPGDDSDDGDEERDPETVKYSDATKNMDKARKTDDGRIFVDATQWTSRRTTSYPTYWNLAGEQIRTNENRKPTMREYVFVKNALLRANHETEASARRIQVGHDMFLLSAVQYTAAMEKANA